MEQYIKPSLELLDDYSNTKTSDDDKKETALRLVEMFKTFGIEIKVSDVIDNVHYVLYEIVYDMSISIKEIMKYENDIRLHLNADEVLIKYPSNGPKVMIAVKKRNISTLGLKEILVGNYLTKNRLTFAVGKTIDGNIIRDAISSYMAHILIGGTTGSGKSRYVDSIILSLIYNYSPDELRFIMIDTKGNEFGIYNNLVHMMMPVVKDLEFSFHVFEWLHHEMRRRLDVMAVHGERNIDSFNAGCELRHDEKSKLGKIVVFVDDVNDLINRAPNSTPEYITKLTLLARAAGIYFVLITQNPSSKSLSPEIKYNLLCRMAFRTTDSAASRNILDFSGAEKLGEYGEMLFYPVDAEHPVMVQTPYVSDREITRVIEQVNKDNYSKFHKEMKNGDIMKYETGKIY